MTSRIEGAGQQASSKRKGGANDNSGGRNKRQKIQRDARTLAVQTSSKAFKNGELDVGAFVKAREYEIRALEQGMARARKGLTQRAFQQVPKDLRRRTASHNAKRVPKRLRGQAVKEMVEDNTPTVTSRRRKASPHMRLRLDTVSRLRALSRKSEDAQPIRARAAQPKKNKVASPPVPKAKYRKRQIYKTWLPTHLFQAKRAHMTAPAKPLWRFALPLTSTVKSYRPTHRASKDRGAIAWDTSYMSTISLQGNEQSIQSLLKALSVGTCDAAWRAKGRKWRLGTRIWQDWLYERDMYPTRPIAPVTIVWRAEPEQHSANKPTRQVFIHVHPSAFSQLWEQVIQLAKVQKPQLTVEDLRFEIGSIQVTGPASTEALTAALWPDKTTGQTSTCAERAWPLLAAVQDPSVLPPGALVTFDASDPRLHHPPRTISTVVDTRETQLLDLLTQWPFDSVSESPGLFDRKKRQASCRAMSSQKAINRRKAATTPGSYPEPLSQDPRIPVIAFASTIQPVSKDSKKARNLCSWTVLLPWKAVPAVWQSLMYYPISTGGQVRLGGLEEQRQIHFETGVPWFPGDFPGTDAGDEWEILESTKRKAEWEAKPKGKRIEWDSVRLGPGNKGEVGKGWACDWVCCLQESEGDEESGMSTSPRTERSFHFTPNLAKTLSSSSNDHAVSVKSLGMALSTVRITLLGRGTPQPCARIYRLPTADGSSKVSLRDQWLALDPARTESNTQKKKRQRSLPSTVLKNSSPAAIQQQLALDLLQPPPSHGDSEDQPPIPDKEDLIGFVTKGEFSLTEGKGVAIGSVFVRKVLNSTDAIDQSSHMCIVRNAGEVVGRLAKLEFI